MRVGAATQLDVRSEAYVAEVLEAIGSHVAIPEAYLIGSGTVGGFDPETGDLDLVVVVERALGPARDTLLLELCGLDCPVRDLQLVVYVEGAQPPDFELNVNQGEERPDEEGFWFVLDAAVAQERAVPLLNDRPWSAFFGRIPKEQVREAVTASLAWSDDRAQDNEFANVHAIRSRYYLEHGKWISKEDATR